MSEVVRIPRGLLAELNNTEGLDAAGMRTAIEEFYEAVLELEDGPHMPDVRVREDKTENGVTQETLELISESFRQGQADPAKVKHELRRRNMGLSGLTEAQGQQLLRVIASGTYAPDKPQMPPDTPTDRDLHDQRKKQADDRRKKRDGGDLEPSRKLSEHRLRISGDAPSFPFTAEFMAPVALVEGAQPRTWLADRTATSYLHSVLVDPSKIVDGAISLADCGAFAEPANPRLNIPMVVRSGDHGIRDAWVNEAGTKFEGTDLCVWAFSRPYDCATAQDVYEVEVYAEATRTGYLHSLTVELGRLGATDSASMEPATNFPVLWGDGEEAIWIKGQVLLRKFLVAINGATIPEVERARWLQGENVARLEGPSSYESGGWGATRSHMPPMSAGQFQKMQGRAENRMGALISGVRDRQTVPGMFKYAGLGPWQPRGGEHGGWAGGDGIHPYTAVSMSGAELQTAWYMLASVAERMMVEDYRATQDDIQHDGSGQEWPKFSRAEYARPYELDLRKFAKVDLAHAVRVINVASACLWGCGSQAAGLFLRRLPDFYSEPSDPMFPAEFEGLGHKNAWRPTGWHMLMVASAIAAGEYVGLPSLAERMLDDVHRVSMPTGLIHRSTSAKLYGTKWGGYLNPDLWEIGKLPPETCVARTAMIPMPAVGAFAIASVLEILDDPRVTHLVARSANSAYWLNGAEPPRSQVIVAGLEPDSILEQPYQVETDDDLPAAWEPQWGLALAYRLTGEKAYLQRAAEIAGYSGDLEGFAHFIYDKPNSGAAWKIHAAESAALSSSLSKPSSSPSQGAAQVP